jgi:hypothetical protein
MRVSTSTSELCVLDDDAFTETSEANTSSLAFDSELSELRAFDPVYHRGGSASLEANVQQRLGDRLAALAEDPDRFHQLLRTAFGEGYDAAAGEALRQRALRGDTSWMPPVRLVDAETLGGANGAYDAASGQVLLNRELDAETLAETYVEEAGHHLDTLLNRSDSRGDEGELFRRLLGGERLTYDQIETVRAENDHGRITVDGVETEVEFWNPFKAAANLVTGAVDVVVDGAKAVGGAVVDTLVDAGETILKAPKTIWDTTVNVVTDVGKGVWEGIKQAGVGSWYAAKDFGKSVARGDIGGAFESVVRFADNFALGTASRIVTGIANGVGSAIMGATELIPFKPLREPIQWVAERGVSVFKETLGKAYGLAWGIIRNYEEAAVDLVDGINHFVHGDWKEGFKDLGRGLWKATGITMAIDTVLLALHSGVSAVQTLVGLEPPGRKLTEAEITEMRRIFGNSIDYDAVVIKEGGAGLFSKNQGNRAFTAGNTIYLKNAVDDPTTPAVDEKMAVLVSEMTHVWQYQHGGSDYAIEALWGQWFGRDYNIDEIPNKRWEDLEPEQQDAFLRFAFEHGAFNTDPPVLVADINHDGTPDNLTDYLRETLEAIRAGRGAP